MYIIILVIVIKPIIGIVSREYFSSTNKKINITYDDIIFSIIKSEGIPILIPCNIDLDDYLDICNGFVFQGGDDINEYNLRNIEMLKKKDIPVLGICLGMQEMFYDDNLILVNNHNISDLHEIIIKKNTLLYNILEKEKIFVNSRHNFCIADTKYSVSSISLDNVIESIEISYLKFFLGLQWHPENLYDIDQNSKKIFDYFVKICNN